MDALDKFLNQLVISMIVGLSILAVTYIVLV